MSSGLKIALGIALTILFLWGYHTAAAASAFLRAGFMGKTGIDSSIAVRKILADNPSVFFTGEADVAFAYGLAPEMRRWNGRYQLLRFYTFTFGKDAMEWNIYLFTEKEEDAEKIRRELASMISELDEKDKKILCVRRFHVYILSCIPGSEPVGSRRVRKNAFLRGLPTGSRRSAGLSEVFYPRIMKKNGFPPRLA